MFSLWGKDWILECYLDELPLQGVKEIYALNGRTFRLTLNNLFYSWAFFEVTADLRDFWQESCSVRT
jgi:hypothetical protein